MKKIIFSLLSFFSLNCIAQSGVNLELLYQWSDENLVGSADFNNTYNEIWGVEVNEREFAIIGSTAGTHIFDVTDPTNSEQIQFIEGADFGPDIIHRDYHDRNGYLYAVSDEGASSLQIIDISQLPDSAHIVYDSNELIKTSHNIFIDETKDILYACNVKKAGSWSATSLALFDISNPVAPVHLIDYTVPSGGGVHDMWVKNDTAFLNNGYNGFFVVDFTDLSNPTIIGSLTEYPDKGYNHSGWPTADMKTYIMADEDWGHDMKVLDISDLSDISVTTTFSSEIHENSIPHNQIIKGDYVYVASYHDGLQVYDISEPSTPTKVAYFNTYLEDDHISYRGAWGVYPLLPSGNILVSDMQYGLYVLAPSSNFNIETVNNQQLNLYPNPASQSVHIQLPETENLLTVKIYDLKGNIVLNTIVSTSKESISIDGLTEGLYVVKAQGNKTLYHQKLIVR
jgi:choice-of-anchor B domain-containing protein